MQSAENGKAEDFRKRFRTLDSLLLDDIQFFWGKKYYAWIFFYDQSTIWKW